MRHTVCILEALALRYVTVYCILMTQVERNCGINLLEAQRWIMRSDRLRGLAALVLPNQAGKRHTTPDKVEASIPTLNEIPIHSHVCLSLRHCPSPVSKSYRAARSSAKMRRALV